MGRRTAHSGDVLPEVDAEQRFTGLFRFLMASEPGSSAARLHEQMQAELRTRTRRGDSTATRIRKFEEVLDRHGLLESASRFADRFTHPESETAR